MPPEAMGDAEGRSIEVARGGPEILRGLDPAAADFARASKAPNTALAYGKAWRAFVAWCAGRGEAPMPSSPESVANFLAAMATAGRKPATLQVYAAAIRQAHMLAGAPAPTSDPKVLAVMSGIRRTLGVAPGAKDAMLADPIVEFCATLPPSLQGARDRAMILVGFAGGFRRSELVAVRVEHLSFVGHGAASAVVVSLPRSKTDQEGAGLEKVIHATGTPTCPVAALRAWLSAASISSGHVFRPCRGDALGADRPLGPERVAELVKRAASRCGLDPSRFAGHSLRAGCVTQAAEADVPLQDIMEVTGHRKAETVIGYIRRAGARRARVTSRLGI